MVLKMAEDGEESISDQEKVIIYVIICFLFSKNVALMIHLHVGTYEAILVSKIIVQQLYNRNTFIRCFCPYVSYVCHWLPYLVDIILPDQIANLFELICSIWSTANKCFTLTAMI